jgi:hypothetical protein
MAVVMPKRSAKGLYACDESSPGNGTGAERGHSPMMRSMSLIRVPTQLCCVSKARGRLGTDSR